RRLSSSLRWSAMFFMAPVVRASKIRSGVICLMVASLGARSTGVDPWQLVQLFLNRLTPVLSDRRCAGAHVAIRNATLNIAVEARRNVFMLLPAPRHRVVVIRELPRELVSRLDRHGDERLHCEHRPDRPIPDIR